MSTTNYRLFLSMDIVICSALTVCCWLSTSSILYWTSTISRSIEFYQYGLMLMTDRMKYLLHGRARRNMQMNSIEHQRTTTTIEHGLLFFSRPDFSNEVNAHNDLLRSQSIA